MEVKDLIGIPYKLGRHDLNKCGCYGAVHLFFKHIKGIDIPYGDGKIILPFWLRNRLLDGRRIMNGYQSVTKKIITNFDDLEPLDIMVYKGLRHDFAVGVIIDYEKCLTTSRSLGTFLMHYPKFRRLFYKGIRVL